MKSFFIALLVGSAVAAAVAKDSTFDERLSKDAPLWHNHPTAWGGWSHTNSSKSFTPSSLSTITLTSNTPTPSTSTITLSTTRSSTTGVVTPVSSSSASITTTTPLFQNKTVSTSSSFGTNRPVSTSSSWCSFENSTTPSASSGTTTISASTVTTIFAKSSMASTSSGLSTTSTSFQPSTTSLDLSGLNYADAILRSHNIHRSENCSSTPDLTWSDELANYAQQIASSCVWKHNTTAGGVSFGQNLGASSEPGDAPNIITNSMYNDEMEYYPAPPWGDDNPDMTNFEKFGHFTQIVWSATLRVGCATQSCPDGIEGLGDGVTYFTVCNYDPPGNVAGEYHNVCEPQGKPIAFITSNTLSD